MNIQSLGGIVINRRRGDITEEEKQRRRNELDQQKKVQKQETDRLYGLLKCQLSDRNPLDVESFLTTFGHLNFFKDYIKEGNKGLVRSAFMKGDLKTFQKNQFITRKGDKNSQFMIILEGQVGLYLEVADKMKASRKQLILIKKLIQGDTIEVGTLINGHNYAMTTQAINDTVQILTLNQKNFAQTFLKFETDKFDADINFLKAVPFISDWPKKNLISLQMCISKFTVPRSQIIFQEGQQSPALFIVKTGEFGQYKKRHFWQRNENLDKGEMLDDNEKFKRIDQQVNDTFNQKEDKSQQQKGTENIECKDNKHATNLLTGKSKGDIKKQITSFLAGSVVEMNSDLIQTFTVFDSFGEKELLNDIPRQYSVVCKSNQGELIQIKSRHFFIITQEEPQLKFSIMTKLMIDYKKQEIHNMRNNLKFQNENELYLLDSHLNNVDDIEQKIKMLDQPALDTSHSYNKPHPFNDFVIENNQPYHRLSRSSFCLNKLSFNPNLQSQASTNKQNTAHIYYQHKQQSKQQDNLSDAFNQQKGIMKQSETADQQPQRKSCLIRDLTQYLKSNEDTLTEQQSQSRRHTLQNKQDNSIENYNSPVLMCAKESIDVTNSSSMKSKSKIDSLQDIDQDTQCVKLPMIKSSQNASLKLSPNTTKYNTSFIQTAHYFSTSSQRGSLPQNTYPKKQYNLNLRKSFNFNTETNYNENNQNGSFYRSDHLNTESGLPSSRYSSRPLANSINYSQYYLNI